MIAIQWSGILDGEHPQLEHKTLEFPDFKEIDAEWLGIVLTCHTCSVLAATKEFQTHDYAGFLTVVSP